MDGAYKKHVPYLAYAARQAFLAAVALVLAAAVLEFLAPGFTVNVYSPQLLLGTVAAFGALSLAGKRLAIAGGAAAWPRLAAAVLVVGTFLVARSYFSAYVTEPAWLALAGAAIAGGGLLAHIGRRP